MMVYYRLAYTYEKQEIVFAVEPKTKRVPSSQLGPIVSEMTLYRHMHLPHLVTCQRWELPKPKPVLRKWLNAHCEGIWCFCEDRTVAFSDDLDAAKFKLVWG